MISKQKIYKSSLIFHPIHGLGLVHDKVEGNDVIVDFRDNEKRGPIKINGNELILVPYHESSLFNYKNNLYEVKSVIVSGDNTVKYKISAVDSAGSQSSTIQVNMNDYNITSIPKEMQSKIRKCNNYCQRYNNTINYLNSKNRNSYFKTISLKQLTEILKIGQLKIKNIDNLPLHLKNTNDNTLEIQNIIKNPFDFIRPDLQVITYKKASDICDELRINVSFEKKCEKWSYDLMHKNNSFYFPSHSFYYFFEEFCKSNSYNHKNYLNDINAFIINKQINGKSYKTTSFLLTLEKTLTDTMIELFYDKTFSIKETSILAIIATFEENEKIELSEQQKTAVINSIINKFYIINGLPGTGKSTIVQCILFVFRELELQSLESSLDEDVPSDDEDAELDDPIVYMKKCKYPNAKNISIIAPTGLAYIGLQNKCDFKVDKKGLFNKAISGTCHRAMYVQYPKIHLLLNKQKYESVIIEKDNELIGIIPEIIIIDEFSMIDSFMYKEILDWCRYFSCRLLILGDENQLPSIGPGCNLKNIIESRMFHQTKLVDIKRQTGILMNNIKKMTTEILNGGDFTDQTMMLLDIDHFIDTESGKITRKMIQSLIENENLDMNKTKFISYFKDEKFIFNVNDLNNILQSIYNPTSEIIHSKSRFKESFKFKVNDIIIRIENDYTTGDIRANGEQCIIKGIYNDAVYLELIEEKKEYKISIQDLYEEFRLAYAVTVHKSQGSQYDNVIIFIDKNQKIWDKPALYTAISRSKNKCIVISKEKDFENIQYNVSQKISLFMKESDNYEFLEE